MIILLESLLKLFSHKEGALLQDVLFYVNNYFELVNGCLY